MIRKKVGFKCRSCHRYFGYNVYWSWMCMKLRRFNAIFRLLEMGKIILITREYLGKGVFFYYAIGSNSYTK